jgi:hypothetical protein
VALPPLATVADLEARGVVVDPSETAVVNGFLETASALVRDAAGSPILETTSSVTLEGTASPWLFLPGLPVRSVTAVALSGASDTHWTLVPSSGGLYRSSGWLSGCEPNLVAVTYVHGLDDVPADIVDLVCRLAGQELAAFRDTSAPSRAVTMERIGDYTVQYATAAESGTMSLTDVQRSRLASRFGGGVGSVRVR